MHRCQGLDASRSREWSHWNIIRKMTCNSYTRHQIVRIVAVLIDDGADIGKGSLVTCTRGYSVCASYQKMPANHKMQRFQWTTRPLLTCADLN